jgi:UDPglucose 6-dehydrogenase
MTISIVGTGKLGAPLVAVLASRGFEVCGIDVNKHVVENINRGIAPVQEPHLQELFTAHGKRIRATSDWQAGLEGTDVTGIIVPTPSGADGAFKNDFVLDAIENIGRVLRRKLGYHLVVIHSTTMPGAVGGPIRNRLETSSGKRVGLDLGLCYNPEFIALGNVVEGLLHPDFVLIGESDERAGNILEGLYQRVVGGSVPITRMNFVNAELTKIAVNTYVTMKISFANMVSEICENSVEADADIVTVAIGQDSRIGSKYLRGGTGYGGPCFPRDTIAFATAGRRVGVDAALPIATHTINERQVDRLIRLVTEHADAGETVAVMGLSYKPGTKVIEQSQGMLLATALLKAGYRVIAHDPAALEPARAVLGALASYADTAEEAVASADIVVLTVPWPEYRGLFAEWRGWRRNAVVLDCWRLIDLETVAPGVSVIQLGLNQPIGATPNGIGAASFSVSNELFAADERAVQGRPPRT